MYQRDEKPAWFRYNPAGLASMYGATLGVIGDWLSALDLPQVVLQPQGTDAHEVALNVRMVHQARRCRRIIAVGGGLEGYLEALHRALGRHHPPMMELVHHLRPNPDDLHIWLDPDWAYRSCEWLMRWAEEDGLVNPSVRQAWRRTQLRFRQLWGAVERVRTLVQGKTYIAVHDAYRPLTRRLGMRSLGSLMPHEEHPPSLQTLRAMVERGRKERVAFVLSREPTGVGATVARLLGVPLLLADTLEHREPTRDYFQRYLDLLATLEAGAAARSNAIVSTPLYVPSVRGQRRPAG
ncbi:MAG: zinc ABC transporter substrate-binding protein [Fimbriimonadales bacterium]